MEQREEWLERLYHIAGALEGMQATQQRHSEQLDRIEGRMDDMEGTVKVHSVVGGSLVAAVVTLAMEYIKSGFSRG